MNKRWIIGAAVVLAAGLFWLSEPPSITTASAQIGATASVQQDTTDLLFDDKQTARINAGQRLKSAHTDSDTLIVKKVFAPPSYSTSGGGNTIARPTCSANGNTWIIFNTTTKSVEVCNDGDGSYGWDPISYDGDGDGLGIRTRAGVTVDEDDDDVNNQPVRGDFSIPSSTVGTPGTANRTVTYSVPDGVYGSGDDVSFTLPGDSDLDEDNILAGVTIFNVTGNIADQGDLIARGDFTIPSSTVGLPGASARTVTHDVPDGIYASGDEVRFTMPGDSDLASSNIRGSKTIFNVAGNLTERGNISIPSSTIGTPGASSRNISYNMSDGIYEGGDRVTFSIPGDSDLAASNIRGGKTIFNVAGNLTERPSVTRAITSSEIDANGHNEDVNLPDGIYENDRVRVTIPTESDLVANNIRAGRSIFSVTGNLTERGDFTIPSGTVGNPGASARTVTYDVPDGIYESGDDVRFTMPGDGDLVEGKIKDGENIFGVEGSYGEITDISNSGWTRYTTDALRLRANGTTQAVRTARIICSYRNRSYMISYTTSNTFSKTAEFRTIGSYIQATSYQGIAATNETTMSTVSCGNVSL